MLRGIVERTGIDPALVDDVIWGCMSQVGELTSDIGRNPPASSPATETPWSPAASSR